MFRLATSLDSQFLQQLTQEIHQSNAISMEIEDDSTSDDSESDESIPKPTKKGVKKKQNKKKR